MEGTKNQTQQAKKQTNHLAEVSKMELISRQAAVDALRADPMGGLNYESILGSLLPAQPEYTEQDMREEFNAGYACGMHAAQPEPLTDQEQRIFLAAMEREEKVCEEVDRNYVREPYEDSLMRVCKEIRRKVKGALWTT